MQKSSPAEVSETSSIHIQLPDIGDIAPGSVVDSCLADVERMLGDQHLEPTALNWIAVCDYFLSLSLISVGRAVAFRLLRKGIERSALGAVRIAPRWIVVASELEGLGKDDRLDLVRQLGCHRRARRGS
jgi:hypothetical protein